MISIQQNVDLTSLNTLRVPATTKYFAQPDTKNQLQEVIAGNNFIHSVFILGGGSNVLFAKDYRGLIIQPNIKGKEVVKEDQKHAWLKVGAGENWHETVCFCVERGWGGIENLSLIPGLVGAAPIQNIGAYGVEFKDVFTSLSAVELETGEVKNFNKEDSNFGYRDSIFKQELKNRFVITDVTLELDKAPEVNTSYGSIQQKLDEKDLKNPSIADLSRIVTEIRTAKLPHPEELPNAGSFFKNPVINNQEFELIKKEYPGVPHYSVGGERMKIPAGWLIEKTGWKGREVNNVGVYEQQALVIVNKGGATGEEILSLSKEIQKSVVQMFGVELVPEVNIV